MYTSKTGQYDVLSVLKTGQYYDMSSGWLQKVCGAFFDKLVHVCSC